MHTAIERNKKFLSGLFSGDYHGNAIIMDAPGEYFLDMGDFAVSDKPIGQWVPWAVKNYENKVKWLEEIDDDSVPYVNMATSTVIFAAAFGCPVHEYKDANPCARPIITSAEEADRLSVPDISAPSLSRILELAELIKGELGPDVPISLPDIQSAFDIAAQIWNKEDFFLTLIDNPDAIKRLVEKCHLLVKKFITEFKRKFPNSNLGHTVNIWTPHELGCCVTEDEAGNISVKAFEEFCLPTLIDLSETFGGIFMHSCADADHQHENFKKVPNLRGINRIVRGYNGNPFLCNPVHSIRDFEEKTVRIVAWVELEGVLQLLDMAKPDTRFLFEMSNQPLKQARKTYELLRERCPRR